MKKIDFTDFSIVEDKTLSRRKNNTKLPDAKVNEILTANKTNFQDWNNNGECFSNTVTIGENESYDIELHQEAGHQGSFSIESKGKNALGIDLKLLSKPKAQEESRALTISELKQLNTNNQELSKFLQEVLKAIQVYICLS